MSKASRRAKLIELRLHMGDKLFADFVVDVLTESGRQLSVEEWNNYLTLWVYASEKLYKGREEG